MSALKPDQPSNWRSAAKNRERLYSHGWLLKAMIFVIVMGSWANLVRILL